MNLRAPWLKRRLALMGFAGWDVGSLYLAYNLTYVRRLGEWEGWSSGLIAITLIWLSISYLTGRYSPAEATRRDNGLIRFVETLLAALGVLAVFIGHSWIYQIIDAQTRFRGFMIPWAGYAIAFSSLGQAVAIKISCKNKKSLAQADVEVLRVLQD